MAPIRPRRTEPRPDAHIAVLDAASFEAVVSHEDAGRSAYRRPTTVVVLELDGLERLVDRLGGAAADRVEPDVADTSRGWHAAPTTSRGSHRAGSPS